MPVASPPRPGSTLPRLLVQSPAKVNLYLGVTATRADGYHELATMFERIALADELTLELRETVDITCACDDPAVPTDERNLVVRAGRALQAATGCRLGAHITIRKEIPSAAGLGGGSSNAAATLRGLITLWDAPVARDVLFGLGERLGADVPFFLADTSWALGVGRGDIIVPVTSPVMLWHVLVTPPQPLSTAAVFRAWDTLGSTAGVATTAQLARLIAALVTGQAEAARDATWNQLTPAAQRLASMVQEADDLLVRCGATAVSLTGSGPTMMATCVSAAEAEAVAAGVRRERPHWRTIVTHTS